jgi:hypothetical protein
MLTISNKKIKEGEKGYPILLDKEEFDRKLKEKYNWQLLSWYYFA